MTISRVWSNGVVSMPIVATGPNAGQPYLASADAAALDANEQIAVSKDASTCSIFGTVTLGAGGSISLDSSTSSFVVGASSSTSTGGRLQCGHGDFPVLSPAIDVFRFVSFGEMFSNQNGFPSPLWNINPLVTNLNWQWYLDPSGSIRGGTSILQIPNSAAVIPLTRLHNGAAFPTLDVYFLVGTRTTRPTRYPGINILQYDPFLNVTTSLSGGWVYFPAAGSTAAYENGGTPNIIRASIGTSAVNVGQYLYFLALLDEDYGGSTDPANEFTGFYTGVSTATLAFQ
jgi:hypothetical protein